MSGDDTAERTPPIDRPQGILTSTERDILLSSEQFDPRGREARSRIRRRLGDALLDYMILDEELPYRDFVQVFASPDEHVKSHIAEGLRAQVRVIYRAADAADLDAEKVVDDAVKEAKGERVAHLVEQLESAPASLTLGEIQTLLRAGEISQREYQEVIGATAPPPSGHQQLEDLWKAGHLSDEEYITLVEQWETEWASDRPESGTAVFEQDGEQAIVRGAVNRAKRKVELAEGQEEARQQMLDELGDEDGEKE